MPETPQDEYSGYEIKPENFIGIAREISIMTSLIDQIKDPELAKAFEDSLERISKFTQITEKNKFN